MQLPSLRRLTRILLCFNYFKIFVGVWTQHSLTLLIQKNGTLEFLMVHQLKFLTHTVEPSIHTCINALTEVQLTWEQQYVSKIQNHTEMFRRCRKIAKSDYQLHLVSPSVRMGQLGSHWMDFQEIWYLLL